jgi:hypothetical protein
MKSKKAFMFGASDARQDRTSATAMTHCARISLWAEPRRVWHGCSKRDGPSNPPDRVESIMTDDCAIPLDCWLQFQGELTVIAGRGRRMPPFEIGCLRWLTANVTRLAKLNDLSLHPARTRIQRRH